VNSADVAVFKSKGDLRNALHGVKGFFRSLQQSREFDAALKQRNQQTRSGKTRMKAQTKGGYRTPGGHYPYLSHKEQAIGIQPK
jgi:hypothetical protein